MKQENTLISVQLPKELLEKIKVKAKEKNLSMTAYIRLLLTEKCKEDN